LLARLGLSAATLELDVSNIFDAEPPESRGRNGFGDMLGVASIGLREVLAAGR
jgi:hypothetical protein